jgi:hypothetical protein
LPDPIDPRVPTVEDAVAAARAAASPTEEGRTVLHCFAGGFIGADWDIEEVVKEIERAREIGWVPHLLGHNLAILTHEGRIRHFQVPAPAGIQV